MKVDIRLMIDTILELHTREIEKKKLLVQVDMEAITITTYKEHLYILLSNIIGNAIKYNKQGGEIHISFSKGTLCIQDTGMGVEVDELPKLFDSFYKGKNGQKKEGFGIGLSLVKKIADMYEWKLEVKNRECGGLEFGVIFR